MDMPSAKERVHQVIDELGRLETFVEVALQGFNLVDGLPSLYKIIRDGGEEMASRSQIFGDDYPAVLSKVAKSADFARNEALSGHSFLFSLAAIRVWGILEAFVSDLCVGQLLNLPRWRDSDAVKRIKLPVVDIIEADRGGVAELLFDELERQTAAAVKAGCGRFEAVLGTFQLSGPIDKLVSDTLFELSQVRNVIVHNGGRADARFQAKGPFNNLSAGDAIVVSDHDFGRYSTAASWYALEIRRRLCEREQEDDPKREGWVELSESILARLGTRGHGEPDPSATA